MVTHADVHMGLLPLATLDPFPPHPKGLTQSSLGQGQCPGQGGLRVNTAVRILCGAGGTLETGSPWAPRGWVSQDTTHLKPVVFLTSPGEREGRDTCHGISGRGTRWTSGTCRQGALGVHLQTQSQLPLGTRVPAPRDARRPADVLTASPADASAPHAGGMNE